MNIKQSLSKILKSRMVFGPFTARRARKHAFILMYHRVLPTSECANAKANQALNVSVEHFDNHLAYLKKWFNVVPLSQLVHSIEAPSTPPSRPSLAITFDDGWRDNYDHAWPLLKKHGLPATIFLVSDYIGTNKKFWWSALEEHYAHSNIYSVQDWVQALAVIAKEEDFSDICSILRGLRRRDINSPDDVIQRFKSLEHGSLENFTQVVRTRTDLQRPSELFDWDQARSMQNAGIEFGAHTERHELLPLLDESSIQKTVRGSTETLREQGLDVIDIFSYPNGDNDESVQQAVSKAGFKYAVGTRRGTVSSSSADLMELPRINIGGGNEASLKLLRQRLAWAYWMPQ